MATRFTVRLETDNAAFEDDHETARILREIADKLDSGHREGSARDLNGNTVGTFGYQSDPS